MSERDARPGPLAGVAVYTLFAGEPDQLLQWCNFHLRAGADRLYVALDRPGPDLVAALPDVPEVHWEVFDDATWDAFYPPQGRNVERKQVDGFRHLARRAAADGHRYLAFVDADELIVLDEDFAEIARRTPEAPVHRLRVREMWYDADAGRTDQAGPFAATLALRRPDGGRVAWSRSFGWRAQFLRNGLMGHQEGKSIHRLPLAAGDLTVHGPLSPGVVADTVEVPLTSGALLHFDSGSFASWNAKWGARLQGSAVATGLGPQRRAQEQLFSHVLTQPIEEQERFFGSFFSLDAAAQEHLTDAGLLARVDVGDLAAGPLTWERGRPAAPALRRLPEGARRVSFQFALVCDQRFVKPTFATMLSVLSQVGDQGSVRFVVLGDGLDAADAARLRRLEHSAYDVEVVVHDITSDLDRDVGTEDAKRATFGRIYLVDYLPPQRTVYLDGDVLATRSIAELFERDLGSACLAGVPDSAALRLVADATQVPIEQRNRLMGITGGDPLEYLNGGVLVFDLDHPDFRELALASRALVVTQGRALKQRDQDAMNLAFAGRKHRLPSTYNYMTQFYASERTLEGDLMQLKYDAADASLVHFSGRIKPWESSTDEFYNGLYRRLVAAAEERVGISCEFYFSRPAPDALRRWSAGQWVETLRSAPGRPAPVVAQPDLTVVDVCDEGLYLRVSSSLYDHARSAGLRLAAQAGGRTLAEVPLDRIGPSRNDLAARVGPGVRLLPLDLAAALEESGGVARHVDLLLTAADPTAYAGFARTVATLEVLTTRAASRPELLADAAVDGVLDAVADGWLTGWFRPRAGIPGDAISLYVDGELAARRIPGLSPQDAADDTGARRFRFNVANLVRLGYGSGGEISVRLAGTNVALRGSPLPVADVDRRLVHDPARGWVESPRSRDRRIVQRVRRRVGRTLRRGRG